MQRSLAAVWVLVLGLSAQAPVDERKQQQVLPDQRSRAIAKEFYETTHLYSFKAKSDEQRREAVARVETLTHRALELARAHPKDPVALDALVQVIDMAMWLENNTSHPGWGKDNPQVEAVAVLLRDHVRSDRLGEACRRLRYSFRQESETFLAAVLQKNSHREMRALACLRLAQCLNGRLQRLDLLAEQPDLAKRYQELFGKQYVEALQHRDRAEAMKEVEALFERAGEEYGDVKVPYGTTVGEQAESELHEIRHLSVGKLAPEIEGEDQDGKRFKLSDYRGKVVLLYFWSEY